MVFDRLDMDMDDRNFTVDQDLTQTYNPTPTFLQLTAELSDIVTKRKELEDREKAIRKTLTESLVAVGANTYTDTRYQLKLMPGRVSYDAAKIQELYPSVYSKASKPAIKSVAAVRAAIEFDEVDETAFHELCASTGAPYLKFTLRDPS